MKTKKTLKDLIIMLSVIAVISCSSNSKISDIQDKKNIVITGNDKKDSNDNGSISYEEQISSQIDRLQKDNVIYFNLDKYDIRSEFTTVLDAHANFLCNNPSYKVIIEGHADERGTPEYNISLGERRANAVKMYLQSKGVSTNQISIISYGKEKPAVLGHDEAIYAKNRRSVLVY